MVGVMDTQPCTPSPRHLSLMSLISRAGAVLGAFAIVMALNVAPAQAAGPIKLCYFDPFGQKTCSGTSYGLWKSCRDRAASKNDAGVVPAGARSGGFWYCLD
jgi:hypothetical protein